LFGVCWLSFHDAQITGADLAVAEDGAPAHLIHQLAHVPRPRVAHEHFHRPDGQLWDVTLILFTEKFQVGLGQRENIRPAIPQGRHRNSDSVQAVVQVFPQVFIGDAALGVTIDSGKEAHVDVDVGVAAYATHHFVLSKAQQFALEMERHLGKFVQKECAAFGVLDNAHPVVASGKRTLGGAKKFALHDVFRKLSAVDADHALTVAWAERMNQFGDNFFACSGFTCDQHRHAGWPYLFCQSHDGFHR